MELAQYCNNQAKFLTTQGEVATAQERNRRAIRIIEGLATPSQSLSMSLLRALQLRIEILESQGASSEAKLVSDRLFEELKKWSAEDGSGKHPELGVFYMNLGIDDQPPLRKICGQETLPEPRQRWKA